MKEKSIFEQKKLARLNVNLIEFDKESFHVVSNIKKSLLIDQLKNVFWNGYLDINFYLEKAINVCE